MSKVLKQAVRALTADKKKLSIVVVLLAMLLLLWGRLLLKRVPRTAVADPETVAVETDSLEVEPGKSAKCYPVVYVDLPQTMSRDIFQFDIDRYQSAGTLEDEGDEDKSPLESPDNELDMQEVRKWADGLVLQAAVLGDEPTVMINDQVYRMGDRIGERVGSFVVKSVRSRRATLSNGTIEIHLEMGD